MNDETRTVFGISPGVRDDDQYHAFVDVLAEVIDGRLIEVSDPKAEFPNVGNVYVSADHWIPPYGVGAIWRVRSARAVEAGARQAEYSAVEAGRPLPLEIIALPVSSESPDDVHQVLVDGIGLGYTPANTALIQLVDGVIVGPVRRDPLSVERGFRCKADVLHDVLGRWSDGTVFGPITFHTRGDRRTFASILNIPQPEQYYDCSEIEHAVRGILRLSRDTLGSGAELFNKQLNTLARAVAELSVSPKLESRLARVQRVMAGGNLGQSELRAFAEYAMSQPSVQAELSVLKEEARRVEQQRVADEQKGLTKQIAEMRKTKSQLEGELGTLQAKIVDAEGQFTAVVDQVTQNISERIEKLRSEPAAMLADIALIRPFLREVPASSQPIEAPLLRLLDRPTEIAEPQTLAEFLACLERSLAAAGLVGGSAKRLSREVMAAAQAGQMTTLTGSLGSVLARACAGVFAAGAASVYRVPVGLLDGGSVSAALSAVIQKAEATDCLAAIILEGANRSALEAYADDLRILVTQRQLNPTAATPGLVLFSTLVEGPSALSLSPSMCELGPILDTDTLSLATRALVLRPHGGRVKRDDWQQWCVETPASEATPDDSIDLQRAMEGEDNVLWRRMLRNAYGRLRAMNDGNSSTPLESLAFGWLIPRAHSCQLSPAVFLDELTSEVMSGENGDPRLKRLVARLFPIEKSSDNGQV